jgi:hypothetical protein
MIYLKGCSPCYRKFIKKMSKNLSAILQLQVTWGIVPSTMGCNKIAPPSPHVEVRPNAVWLMRLIEEFNERNWD